MEQMQFIITILSLIISLGTVCTMIYAFSKFLKEPRVTLEGRVNTLESRVKDVELSLVKDTQYIKEQEETNQVLIHSVLALIEFEIQYCLTEHKEMSKDLKKAKENLHSYLARK